MNRTFSIKESIKYAWGTLLDNAAVFAVAFGIMLGVQVVFFGGQRVFQVIALIPGFAFPALGAQMFTNIISMVVSMLMTAGLIRVTLRIYDGEKLDAGAAAKELFVNYKYLVSLLLAMLVTMAIFFGLMLTYVAVVAYTLLTPYLTWDAATYFGLKTLGRELIHNPRLIASIIGISVVFGAIYIYIVTRMYFYTYLIVDKSLGPIDAIRKSFEITSENFWRLFGYSLAIFGMAILGLLACCIGILVVIPITWMSTIFIYKKLMGEGPAKKLDPAIPEARPVV